MGLWHEGCPEHSPVQVGNRCLEWRLHYVWSADLEEPEGSDSSVKLFNPTFTERLLLLKRLVPGVGIEPRVRLGPSGD